MQEEFNGSIDHSNAENKSVIRGVIHQEAKGQQGGLPKSAPLSENSQRTLIDTTRRNMVAVLKCYGKSHCDSQNLGVYYTCL